MIKKFWNLKTAILAFEIAFILCFINGVFWDNIPSWKQPSSNQKFNETSWYYLNRGLFPKSWAGISVADKTVEFPIIKMPLLTITENYSGIKFNKIINLEKFTGLFLITFLIMYLLTYPLGRASDENKSLNYFLIPMIGILFLLMIFVYFFIFPRI